MYIDFHAHILPGLDHGCRDIEEAEIQLQQAKAAGVDCIVATSHFYPHSETVDSFLSRRKESLSILETLAEKYEIKVIPGAEVLLCAGMETMADLEKLCALGSNTLLLELPLNGDLSEHLLDSIDQIQQKRGIRILLAHVERYPKELILSLMEKGIKVQMNANYIAAWKPHALLKKALKQQSLYAIGSDIHGTKNGYKAYGKAVKKLGKEVAVIMERSKSLL